MRSSPFSRRSALKAGLAASVYVVTPFNILKGGPSPNSKLNIACIGVGGQGSTDAMNLMADPGNQIVAFCDVHKEWHKYRISKREPLRNLNVPLYKDYREMFYDLGDKIDAVTISTPEHSHFAISMFFIRRGKHVYCQKPLCHTVNEVRLLVGEARKYDVVTQMGNQGHSTDSASNMRDWIQAGVVGDIREVIALSHKNYFVTEPPKSETPIKDSLDWDLFLNRAAYIPFSESYMNRNWISYSHFSGAIGDMGAHILDPAYYSLDLQAPESVRADVETPAIPGSLPPNGIVTWEFPARGNMPPVRVKYYLHSSIAGKAPYPKHLPPGKTLFDSGSYLIGQSGTVYAGSHSQGGRIAPDSRMKDIRKVPKITPRFKGNHYSNWTSAIRGKGHAFSNFDYAGPLSEIIILGDVALLHPNKTLKWDSKRMRITNDKKANKSIFMRRQNPRDDLGWI